MSLSTIIAAYVLAEHPEAQGRLREAGRIYERALQLPPGRAIRASGTADLYVGLSELHREHDDLEAAAQLPAEKQGAGRARWATGNALSLVRRAWRGSSRPRATWTARSICSTRRSAGTSGAPDPEVRPVAALKARVWIAQGRLAEALDWARERGLSVDDDLSYLREFEHITLARAAHRPATSANGTSALHPRGRRTARAPPGRRRKPAGGRAASSRSWCCRRSRIEAQGDIPRALVPLERALTLAEPEGYVRIFVDEGAPMRDLLRHAAAGGVGGAYARRLLSAFDEPAQPAAPRPGRGSRPRRAAHGAGARDPASRRGGHAEPGDRRPAVHQPGHGQAAHRERLRQAGRRPPHRGCRPGNELNLL